MGFAHTVFVLCFLLGYQFAVSSFTIFLPVMVVCFGRCVAFILEISVSPA